MNKYISLYKQAIEKILKFRRTMKQYQLYDEEGIDFDAFETLEIDEYKQIKDIIDGYLYTVIKYKTDFEHDFDNTIDYHPDINKKTLLLYFIFVRLYNYHVQLNHEFDDYLCVINNLTIDSMVLTSIDFFCRTIDERFEFVNGSDYDDLGATLYIDKQYSRIESFDIISVSKAVGS